MLGVRMVQRIFFFTAKNATSFCFAPTLPMRSSSSISVRAAHRQRAFCRAGIKNTTPTCFRAPWRGLLAPRDSARGGVHRRAFGSPFAWGG